MKRPIIVAIGLAWMVSAVCAGLGESPFVKRWRSFRADARGASYGTKKRALKSLSDELFMQEVRFEGKVTRVGSLSLRSPEASEGGEMLRAISSWEYEGISVPPRGCEGRSDADTARIAGERLRSWLPEGDEVQLVMVATEEVAMTLIFQDVVMMDRLRSGQRVRVKARLFGLFGESFYGLLDDADPISD